MPWRFFSQKSSCTWKVHPSAKMSYKVRPSRSFDVRSLVWFERVLKINGAPFARTRYCCLFRVPLPVWICLLRSPSSRERARWHFLVLYRNWYLSIMFLLFYLNDKKRGVHLNLKNNCVNITAFPPCQTSVSFYGTFSTILAKAP